VKKMPPKNKILSIAVILAVLIAGFTILKKEEIIMDINLIVTSSAFKNGESIPIIYSGFSDEISPPITLGEMGGNSKSIAIIMEDLDTPIGAINHWVLWNIPAGTHEIPENIPRTENVDILGTTQQGKNLMRKIGYMGPKPPWGTHRYIFRVYVLDAMLDIKPGSSQKKLEKAIKDHILQYGELMGTYKR